jgi:hypothetical protein
MASFCEVWLYPLSTHWRLMCPRLGHPLDRCWGGNIVSPYSLCVCPSWCYTGVVSTVGMVLYQAFYAHRICIYISFLYWTVAQGSGDARACVTTIPIMYLRSVHGWNRDFPFGFYFHHPQVSFELEQLELCLYELSSTLSTGTSPRAEPKFLFYFVPCLLQCCSVV